MAVLLLKQIKPTLRDTSVQAYAVSLKSIAPPEATDLEFLKDTDDVMSRLEKYKPNTQKNYLNAAIVVLKGSNDSTFDKAVDFYETKRDKFQDDYQDLVKSQKKTASQEANWVEWPDYEAMVKRMQASTTYKHYLVNQTGANPTNATHNISTQVKSLKGLIVRPQNNALTGAVANFPISTGQAMQIDEMQFKVGSILYPQEPIKFSNNNRGEMYNEIRKCFGTIGSYNHGTMLNATTFKQIEDDAAHKTPGAGNPRQLWVAAYDFETFAKSATESGLNTSDRALPVSFTVKTSEVAGAITALNVRYDVFAMADCILYISLDGTLSTRI